MISQNILNTLIPILQAHGVKKASVFGSYATGTQRADSDLDLMVQFPEKSSLFDLVGLELELRDALNLDVDVLTYNTQLHSIVREGIQREQIAIL